MVNIVFQIIRINYFISVATSLIATTSFLSFNIFL